MSARTIEVLHRGRGIAAVRTSDGWRVEVDGVVANARFLADALAAAGVRDGATTLALEILTAEAEAGAADPQPAVPTQGEAPNTLVARPTPEPD